MLALFLWASAIVVAFCAGYATAYSERRRNRRVGSPDPRIHRAGSVVDFKRRIAAQRWP